MRLLLAVVACGVLFFGVFLAGTKVFASDEGAAEAAGAPSDTTTANEETADEEKGSGSKSGADSHAPRKHRVAADVAIARKAVLHAKDVGAGWHQVPLPTDKGRACPENDPDLSRFTITGEARSIFENGGGARTESRVRLFENGGQAALYFEATNNRTILRCIRDGVKGWLGRKGWKPRLLYARLETQPPIGSQTAIYLVDYVITLSDGTRQEYPVELITFQVGRAVGALQFNFIFSPDGSRPCQCELDEARLVSSRLYRT